MKNYQPLVLQELDIRLPQFHVCQLAVHRHLPETTDVRPHKHPFCQCLAYLSGRGVQEIHGRAYPIETGTAVFLPPRVSHAFRRAANRRPICMVLDFEWQGAKSTRAQVVPLPLDRLHEVRRLLARLVSLQRNPVSLPGIQLSALILSVMDHLLTSTMAQGVSPAGLQSPVARKLDRLLSTGVTASEPLSKLAALAGYQRDYLNRLLKQDEGLTLGQLRARKRLVRAQQLLRRPGAVSEVADEVGFSDPNYFARWYRKQTGMTPVEWRRQYLVIHRPATAS